MGLSLAYRIYTSPLPANFDGPHGDSADTAAPNDMYEVYDLPGRGKGMIATRDIKVGLPCKASCARLTQISKENLLFVKHHYS